VRIRLTRKLADELNGLNLRPYRVGEVIDLADPLARMLIAERWAEEAIPIDWSWTADERPTPRRNLPKRRSRRGDKP
jgi:hypothetical protein